MPSRLKKIRGTVDGVTGATKGDVVPGKVVELIFRKEGEEELEATTYSLLDFIACIRNNKKPISNADTGRVTSIAIHMGNAAADSKTMQVWKAEYPA